MQPLPEGTHLLHIGPQKTGSTAIQGAMHLRRRALREHGVLYPGSTMRPRAVAEVGLGFTRRDARRRQDTRAWEAYVQEVHAPGPLRVCVSLEAFGRAGDEQARRIVGELGGERPHVLAVARRYDSLMPSQWQQRVKSGMRLSYADWLRIVLGDPDPEDSRWNNVWVPHDTPRLLERWSEIVGPENVTLLVGDERNRSLLPRTFEELLALPEGILDVTVRKQNQSLTYGQVEVVRQLNIVFGRRKWPQADYQDLVRRGVVPGLLAAPPSPDDPRIPALPGWAHERIVELSEDRIARLRDLPVRVVGDLEALRVPPGAAPSGPEIADGMVSLETVGQALEGMAVASRRRQRQLRQRQRTRLEAARTTTAPAAGSGPLATLRRTARGVRRRLRPRG